MTLYIHVYMYVCMYNVIVLLDYILTSLSLLYSLPPSPFLFFSLSLHLSLILFLSLSLSLSLPLPFSLFLSFSLSPSLLSFLPHSLSPRHGHQWGGYQRKIGWSGSEDWGWSYSKKAPPPLCAHAGRWLRPITLWPGNCSMLPSCLAGWNSGTCIYMYFLILTCI